MSTASCELYVDKARLPDTGPEYLASVPTALAGFKLTWGRSTTMEQPATSTATFTVADIDPDDDFLDVLHVGAVVDCYAAGDVTAGTSPVNIAVDGGFETAALADRVASAGSTTFTTDAYAGSRALLTRPPGYPNATTGAQRLLIPPAPFSSSATAWNTLTQVTAGDSWSVDLMVKLGEPTRIGATLSAAVFPGPTSKTAGATFGPATAVPAAAGWQRVTAAGTVPADVPYGWAGLQLDVQFAVWNGPITAAAGAWSAQPGTWMSWGTVTVDEARVWAPPAAVRRVLVFTGRITDLHAQATATGVGVDVTATDWTADLANTSIGDTPWPVQTIATRVKRILALVAASIDPVDQAAVQPVIDPVPGAFNVTWRDVDAQPAMQLLDELADTGDAVLWPVFSASVGFYLWFEDPTLRQASAMLAWNASASLVQITGNTAATRGVVLTACDLLEDPAQWTQDVADVITRVNGTWQEQTVDDQGQPAPTERSLMVNDPNAEAPKSQGGLGFGVRAMSYTSQLVSQADLFNVANRVLARSRALGWRLSGITWDTNVPEDFAESDTATLLTLLDGAKRPGLPVTVTDMPGWTPTGGVASTYLEGGEYSFDGARWTLDMTLSPSGQTAYSAAWFDLDPAWHWNQMDPSITWNQLWGVTSSAASLRWRQLDKHAWSADTKTWLQYRGTGT
jgi:hypothetical protein